PSVFLLNNENNYSFIVTCHFSVSAKYIISCRSSDIDRIGFCIAICLKSIQFYLVNILFLFYE
ncbi:hypothetical protein ACX5HH_002810, partial [Providencia stuartii]